MKNLFLIIFLMLSVGYSKAQAPERLWSKHISPVNIGNNPSCITTDNSGNVYIGSLLDGINLYDYQTVKLNSSGDTLWSATYNGSANFYDIIKDIVVDNLGNVYVTGISRDAITNDDVVTIKYNSIGQQLWLKKFSINNNSQESGEILKIDNSGNIYVLGFVYEQGGINTTKVLLLKYTSSGNLIWSKTYAGTNQYDMTQYFDFDDSGNIYAVGSRYDLNGQIDMLLIKFDSEGNFLWEATHNSPYNNVDYGNKVCITDDNSIYIGGTIYNNDFISDMCLIKFDSSGNKIWVRTYNGNLNSDDNLNNLESDNNGDIFISGTTVTFIEEEQYKYSDNIVIKYDNNGNIIWNKLFGIPGNITDYYGHFTVDVLGNSYLLSNTYTDDLTFSSAVIVKYDPLGNVVYRDWDTSENTSGNYLHLDNENYLYLLGTNNYRTYVVKYSQEPSKRKPVFILPGVGATYSANINYDMGWMLNRGIHPDSIQIDPLARVYNDLITTLENNGYVKNKDLFIVNYDWRLQPGPVDDVFDGKISGLTAQGISDNNYLYSIDYFGWYMKKAMDRWRADHNEELDSIDIISHSTGGLVSRTYIQSDAYGGVYDSLNGYKLPKVKNLLMLGVPNRGASKPWNVLQDNWSGDPAYRFVLSKLINRAFQKVMQGFTITGLDYNITKASILDKDGNPDKKLFIYRYVPTLRYLVSTYPFIDFGSGLETINNDPEIRNSILLDLNNGADINAANDPNGFTDSSNVSVLYSSFVETAIHSKYREDFEFNALHSFTDFVPRNVFPGQGWFQDLSFPSNGDGTVPTISSAGQFTSDTRVDIYEFNFTDHTAMVGKKQVQATVLDILGFDVDSSTIATGSGVSAGTILNVISDPVEIVVTDGLGRRLGYLESTGSLNEIPNSFWFGDADGIGYAYNEIVEPLNVQLTGMGENYYVMVSVEEFTGESGGVVMQGFLEEGEQINYQITIDELKNFDAGVTAIVSPTKNQILNNSGSNISAYVKNFGDDTIKNCNVFYTYNGETKGPVKVSGNLAPGDSALVTFNNAYRLKSGENIINGELNVFIGDSGDTATNNNEKNISVSLVQPVTSFPFNEKFNNINKLPLSGDSALWKINITTNPSGVAGDSSLQADFFNNLSGTSFVYTPILNLDSLEKPVLSFYMAYTSKLAMQNDLLEVVISKDGGATIDTVVYSKDFLSNPSLATVSPQNNEFTPSQISNWRNVILDLRKYSGENIVIGFRAVSAGGNNLWIDELTLEEYDEIYSIPVAGAGIYGNADSNFIQFNITGFSGTDKIINNKETDGRSLSGELTISRTDTIPVNKTVNVNAIATSQSGAIFTPDYFFDRYWNVSFSGDDYNSNAVFDLVINISEYAGDMDPGRLYLLRRKSNTDNWECVSTITEFDGINPVNIKAFSLQGFGQFAIATDESSLPVELVSFTSLVERNNVKLNWSTATEINNSGFEIERKGGLNESWVKLGFIDGFGNTNEIKNYNYNDRNLNTGRYNYRLKQIDYNGNFEYYDLSSEVTVGVPDKYDLSQNYPNPFNPVTKINYDLPFDSRVMMKVYDITGREVFTLVNEQKPAGYYTVQFDAGLSGSLASGVYFYKLIANGLNGQEFVLTKKIMLVK
ncbi:MAG TPA: choice-of-anchor J domain-containing protein [Ignavibacteria bacterium]|nr:choice-of-anchor J domain-containing protein [Ignavibacteria bacterium]